MLLDERPDQIRSGDCRRFRQPLEQNVLAARPRVMAPLDGVQHDLRTVVAVTFMSIVAVWVGVAFARAPEDTSTKTLPFYGAVFFWAFSAIGFGKMWFAMMQNDIGIREEIKRMEVLLLEMRERPSVK